MFMAEIEELPRISKSKLGKRLANRFPYLLFEIFGLKLGSLRIWLCINQLASLR